MPDGRFWLISDRRVRRSRPALCDYTSVCSAISKDAEWMNSNNVLKHHN